MTSAGEFTIRRVAEEERLEYLRFVLRGFHEHYPDEVLEGWFAMMRTGRYDVAIRDGEMVGSAAAYHGTLSVPGGGEIGCAQVTAVTVRADARRRGLLRAMMRRVFAEAREAGLASAALFASEGGIYGRFGFGPAVPMRAFEVAHHRAALTVPPDVDRVRIITTEHARTILPVLYERVRRERAGLVDVSDHWWDHLTTIDPEEERDGWSPRRYAAIGERAVVGYRVRESGGEDEAGRLRVVLLLAEVGRDLLDLWGFVASIDLIGTIEINGRPLDDPLLLALGDETRIRLSRWDSLWLRLLDVPGAIQARSTHAEATVVVELADDEVSANAGRWRVSGQDGVLACEPSRQDADLSMDVAGLSTLCLGGVRPTTLVDARRVVEHTPGAAVALGRLLAADRAPWSPLDF